MSRIKKLSIFFVLISRFLFAQYFGETVQEKSFERTDFFFTPSTVNPYGLGGFGSAALGLVNDPLMNLIIHPSTMVSDSALKHFTYINFRNSKEVEDKSTFYPWYRNMLAVDSYIMPYSTYWTETRKEMEPVISVAYFIRPLGEHLSNWTLGMTYQAIFQDEEYYEISQDIYRSNVGTDWAGNRTAEFSDTEITDRYSGQDDMHQEGHFLSLYSGLALTSQIHFSTKISRASFDREGGYGSTVQWDNGMFPDQESQHKNVSERKQNYRHWDISGGLLFQPKKNISGGITGGYLWGDVDQMLERSSGSLYRNGTIDQGTNWNYYIQEGFTDQTWVHEGKTKYGSVHLQFKPNPKQTFLIFYKIQRGDVDIALQSAVNDTSYSNYYHEHETWLYGSESNSAVHDNRTGDGTEKSWHHHIAAALQWQATPRAHVALGVHYHHQNRKTQTSEDVIADRFSEYSWFNIDSDGKYYNATYEDKILNWELAAKTSRIQIPIIMTYQFSPVLKVQFGINRSMTRWSITDETLALFNERISTRDGQTETKRDFGERYTQPKEIESDVTTTLLGGITVAPSSNFEIQLLAVPNFVKTYQGTTYKEFQWWIDFRLFP